MHVRDPECIILEALHPPHHEGCVGQCNGQGSGADLVHPGGKIWHMHLSKNSPKSTIRSIPSLIDAACSIPLAHPPRRHVHPPSVSPCNQHWPLCIGDQVTRATWPITDTMTARAIFIFYFFSSLCFCQHCHGDLHNGRTSKKNRSADHPRWATRVHNYSLGTFALCKLYEMHSG